MLERSTRMTRSNQHTWRNVILWLEVAVLPYLKDVPGLEISTMIACCPIRGSILSIVHFIAGTCLHIAGKTIGSIRCAWSKKTELDIDSASDQGIDKGAVSAATCGFGRCVGARHEGTLTSAAAAVVGSSSSSGSGSGRIPLFLPT